MLVFLETKPQTLLKKSNVINKIRCILNGDVHISEKQYFMEKNIIINKIACI
jgi:hypothetical protein